MTRLILSLIALAALGAPALAGPGRHEAREVRERIATVAHRLENASRKVHRTAERLAHHGSFREEKALQRLHTLEREARRFHRRVERRGFARRTMEADLRVLLRAFYRAENSLHWLHAYDVVHHDFVRVERLVEDLQLIYELDSYAWHARRFGRRGRVRARIAWAY